MSGCFVDSDPVSQVKNGTLDFDKRTTVGKAFDHFRYFDGGAKWEAFQAENGVTVVHASGVVNLRKIASKEIAPAVLKSFLNLGTRANTADAERMAEDAKQRVSSVEILVEFLFNQDKTFRLGTTISRIHSADGQTSEDIPDPEEDPLSTLKEIYANEVPSVVGAAVTFAALQKEQEGRQ